MSKKPGKTGATPARSSNLAAAQAARASDLRPGLKIRVRATSLGYYGEIRRREGDVFTFTVTDHEVKRGLPKWVERVPSNTPPRITTGKEELRRKHDELLRERNPQVFERDDATGDLDPLGSGD